MKGEVRHEHMQTIFTLTTNAQLFMWIKGQLYIKLPIQFLIQNRPANPHLSRFCLKHTAPCSQVMSVPQASVKLLEQRPFPVCGSDPSFGCFTPPLHLLPTTLISLTNPNASLPTWHLHGAVHGAPREYS